MYDEDDDLEMDAPGGELFFSSQELCQYAFEALERAHPEIKIVEISFCVGGFDFSVSADLTKHMPPPNCWKLHSFGDGKVNFRISLDDFQHLYHKLEERDFIDLVKVAINKYYGKVAELVSVEHLDQPIFEDGVEVKIRMKEGCKFENFFGLPIDSVDGNIIVFQVDAGDINEMMEHGDAY